MNKDILAVVDVLAAEHKLSDDLIFNAVEQSLAVASRKDLFSDDKVFLTATIDRKTGSFTIFRNWTVVDDNEESFDNLIHFYKDQADEIFDGDYDYGFVIQKEIAKDLVLTRVAAQIFKMSLRDNIRLSIKNNAQEKFKDRIGELFNVKVVRFSKGDVFVEINDDVEGVIKKESAQKTDRFKIGQIVPAVLYSFDANYKGHQLMFERNSVGFIEQALTKEIPEIQDGTIELLKVSKINNFNKVIVGVRSHILDPIGICIGYRAERIKSIKKIIGSFNLSFVFVYDDIEDTISNIFKNKMKILLIDEHNKRIDIGFTNDDFESYLNAKEDEKILSDFFGMTVSFTKEQSLSRKQNEIILYFEKLFSEKLDINTDLARILYDEGFEDFESILFVDDEEFLEIDGFDRTLVLELKKRAKEVLDNDKNAKSINDLSLCHSNITKKLKENNILSIQDLADLSNSEFIDLVNLRINEVDKIILLARNLTI